MVQEIFIKSSCLRFSLPSLLPSRCQLSQSPVAKAEGPSLLFAWRIYGTVKKFSKFPTWSCIKIYFNHLFNLVVCVFPHFITKNKVSPNQTCLPTSFFYYIVHLDKASGLDIIWENLLRWFVGMRSWPSSWRKVKVLFSGPSNITTHKIKINRILFLVLHPR